jgi:hypothetical protein
LRADPELLEGEQREEGVRTHRVRIEAAATAREGLHLIALDVTRDGRRHGELFDCIVHVDKSA